MTFRDLSIRRKMTVLILSSSVLGLVMACVGLAAYERTSFRASTTNEISALADTLGANAAASLVFNDPKTAADMLGALATEQHILGARLYDANGKVFAEYRREGAPKTFMMPSWRGDGATFTPDSLVLFRSVSLNGEKAGSIAIVSDLIGFRAKLVEYTKIAACRTSDFPAGHLRCLISPVADCHRTDSAACGPRQKCFRGRRLLAQRDRAEPR